MRTGVFGGSFDPPHLGHLIVAENVRFSLKLDRVIWIPAKVSPNKGREAVASERHRYKMVELAIAGNSHFSVSDIELSRGGVSYTVDTLAELSHSGREKLFLIMGSDSFATFDSWRDPDRIAGLAGLVVYPRHGVPFTENGVHKATMVNSPMIEVSSTSIRERVRDGASIRYLVPDAVREYVMQHRLYGE